MAQLRYSAICSLDGYTVDSTGRFDWAAPDEEVHAFVNDLEREVGTYLYGRRMYETMRVWEDLADDPMLVVSDFARVWKKAHKVVYSASLAEATTDDTVLERHFDPAAVRALVAEASAPVSIGGATIAATALTAGIVDRIDLTMAPVIVGGGTSALPQGVRLDLELIGEHRFANGFVHVLYRVAR